MDTDITNKLTEVEDWLQKEYSGIRTGQASPALLDSIKVDNYGSFTPLNQVGSIGVEDARTLRVSPWDISQVPAIEKALTEADLGVSVSTDSGGLRVIFPDLTAERREQLLKLAKSKLEDARISVRAVRDEAMKVIEKGLKDGDFGEDEKFDKKESVQTAIDDTNKKLEVTFDKKELELKQ